MALNQNSSDKIESTNPSHEDLSPELGISSISSASNINSYACYVELFNENSNDSQIASSTETNQGRDVMENVTSDELVEDTNCINESCLTECDKKLATETNQGCEVIETFINCINEVTECDKKLETAGVNLCDNVSSDSTPQKTSIEVQVAEKKLPMKSIAEQKVNEARQRRNSDSWTEDSSSSSSSDSDFFEELHNSITPKTTTVKTKGELELEDLPPIEDLQISVEEKELMKIGHIHAIVTKQVVVIALKDQKPLDLDSVLFLSHDKPLGRIFDVFGPVSEPFYIVRFNSPEDIISKGVNINADVYFAPQKSDITSFVFVDVLRLQKGSDASWKDNNEPPEEFLDYSDDEQERMAKQKRRGKNRSRQDADVQFISCKKPANNETKSVPTVESNRNVFSNYKETKFQLHQSQPSRNPFRRTFYSMNNGRKIAVPNKLFSDRSSPAHTSTSLDDVPIWISSPPPFFQSTVSTSQQNMPNTISSVSMICQQQSLMMQHSSQQMQHSSQQIRSPQPVPSYSPVQQIRPSQLVMLPKQPYIPRQPQNNPSIITQTQNQFQRQEHINPPGPSMHQQVQQNIVSQAPVFQNLNQPYSYRPVICTMAPVVSFSTQAFNSCNSNSVTSTAFVPTNYQTFAASPFSISGSNHPHWLQREQARSPFTVVQSPPPTVQFGTQVPSFPALPPLIRFNAAQNCPIPPPQPPSSLSQQFLPNHSRF